jgi:hypothetical protein
VAKDFKRSFRDFVGLVKAIPEVRHVVGFEDEADIYTYIDKADMEVCYSVFRAQHEIRGRYPSPELDFHIRFLDGRQFVAPEPALVFSR